jgi:hypothetical protein
MTCYSEAVTETQTFPLLFQVEAVEPTWGNFDCQRLATPAEMAETGNHCVECGVHMTSKVGGGVVQGTMLGYRAHVEAPWGWDGPFCHPCEVVHAVADGYGK